MVLALLVCQTLSPAAILHNALHQIEDAQTISVTMLRTTEEIPRSVRTKYWFRKGGFFRADSGTVIDVSNPKQGWTYRADKKIYQSRKPLPATFSPIPVLGLDILKANLPIVGEAKQIEWHKRSTTRIELDARKMMTKETKLYAFIDAKTHMPYGISANLGSITQVVVLEDLEINPKIEDAMFQFKPPKDWKQVTPGSGGWN